MLNFFINDVYITHYVGNVPVLGFVPKKTTLEQFITYSWIGK